MTPGPVAASPPATRQMTSAGPPPASVAENCSAEPPLEPAALQPAQLVSMAVVPGLIAKTPLLGLAPTMPALQPARARSAGAARARAARRAMEGTPPERREGLVFGRRIGLAATDCSTVCNVSRVPFDPFRRLCAATRLSVPEPAVAPIELPAMPFSLSIRSDQPFKAIATGILSSERTLILREHPAQEASQAQPAEHRQEKRKRGC